MVSEGLIDKNEYIINDNGHVLRINPGTGEVVGDYTMHHVADYDVRNGTFTMQLVETEAHDSVGNHWGAHKQIYTAYDEGTAEAITQYNEAKESYLEQRKPDNIVKEAHKQAVDTKKIVDRGFKKIDDKKDAMNDTEDQQLLFTEKRYQFMSAEVSNS